MSTISYITPENVKALWEHFQKKYKAKIVKKNKSTLMKTVGWYLDVAGYMSKSDFMNHYTTTVKHKIYVPKDFELGIPNKRSNIITQFDLACHEFTHVLQNLGLSYVTKPSKRLKAETDAFIASMEIYHFLTGNKLNPDSMAVKLKPYGIEKEGLKYASKKYRTANLMIEQGLYKSETVLEAIHFLKNR